MCHSNSRKSTRQYILRTPKLRSISECRKFAKVRPQIRSAGRGIAEDCALLLLSVSTDTKKNPNGRVRYPIKHDWNSDHGKTLSGTCRITPVYRGRVQGLDLEVGSCGIATRAVNWYLIRQKNQPQLPLSLYNI